MIDNTTLQFILATLSDNNAEFRIILEDGAIHSSTDAPVAKKTRTPMGKHRAIYEKLLSAIAPGGEPVNVVVEPDVNIANLRSSMSHYLGAKFKDHKHRTAVFGRTVVCHLLANDQK